MMPQTWPGTATSLTLHTESRDFKVGVGLGRISPIMILGAEPLPACRANGEWSFSFVISFDLPLFLSLHLQALLT